MRVLHIVPALFDHDDGTVGGGERYALELARHMAEQVSTRLVAFGERERRLEFGRLEARVIGEPWHVRGQRSNPLSWALLGEIRRADVVHCHQQHVVSSSLGAIVCRLTGRRVFVTDLGGGGWDISGYISTDRWYHGHMHISEYSRAVFGHAEKPWAHVIGGGVDTEKFSPDGAVARDDTILFVGRLLPHKGIEDLFAAAKNMQVEVIGPAPDPTYLTRLHALAHGVPVRFRHGCGDEALVESYRRARCAVLLSVYRTPDGRRTNVPELLGQTLLEAMACETPVICTRVASLPEVAEDGVTGFVVPPNDPASLRERLEWLRDHPHEAETMGRAGRQRVLERFTWKQVVRRCLEIYRLPDSRA